jgi:G3E family GTPase
MGRSIPTNLILGFLGSGKTTAISNLLEQKPEDETWAVLVNEFGEVGIDGQLLSDRGARIKEVPGGCMCCVAGLPMQMGLNMLIQKANPDRLLIEPTGLGHPHQILETLQSEFYRDQLRIEAYFALVDPGALEDRRICDNENFQAQVTVADVLLGNKGDRCSAAQKEAFLQWGHGQRPPKQQVYLTEQGAFPSEWLALPHLSATPAAAEGHNHAHGHEPARRDWQDLAERPWQQALNKGEGHFSCGWRLHPQTCLDYAAVQALAHDLSWLRFKGFLNTTDGWVAFNASDNGITTQPIPEQAESRLEIISDRRLDGDWVDARLRRCVSAYADA